MNKTPTDDVLSQDEFWFSAFDENNPFREDFVTEFRRGIAFGGEEDLAWAKLAIYGIGDHALWPILVRLIEWANVHPRADFVEILVFFLCRKESFVRFRRIAGSVSIDDRKHAVGFVEALQLKLLSLKDVDLAESLDDFKKILIEGEFGSNGS